MEPLAPPLAPQRLGARPRTCSPVDERHRARRRRLLPARRSTSGCPCWRRWDGCWWRTSRRTSTSPASTTPPWTATRCARRTWPGRRPSVRSPCACVGEVAAGYLAPAPGGAGRDLPHPHRGPPAPRRRTPSSPTSTPTGRASGAGAGAGVTPEEEGEVRVFRAVERGRERALRGGGPAPRGGRPAGRVRWSARRRWASWPRSGGRGCGCPAARAWPSSPPGTRWCRSSRRSGPGQIRNANTWSLAGPDPALRRGAHLDLGIVPDRPRSGAGAARWKACARGADLLLTSGGVSMGDYDVVKAVLQQDGEIAFWSIDLRPGKPLAFGRLRRGADHGPARESGLHRWSPSSSSRARPCCAWPGTAGCARWQLEAVALQPITNRSGRENFMRGRRSAARSGRTPGGRDAVGRAPDRGAGLEHPDLDGPGQRPGAGAEDAARGSRRGSG